MKKYYENEHLQVYAPTLPNWRRLKINPSKHPGEGEDIVQEEKVLAMENKDEGTEVSLYNIFKKRRWIIILIMIYRQIKQDHLHL